MNFFGERKKFRSNTACWAVPTTSGRHCTDTDDPNRLFEGTVSVRRAEIGEEERKGKKWANTLERG